MGALKGPGIFRVRKRAWYKYSTFLGSQLNSELDMQKRHRRPGSDSVSSNVVDLRIALIDSGVDVAHPALKGARVSMYVVDFTTTEPRVIPAKSGDSLGHGTACASIIHRSVPQAEIVSIKIFSKGKTANELMLIEALRWCLLDESIRVVNVSLGCSTEEPNAGLYRECEEAFQKGVFIVAALNNDAIVESYPACFPNVLSVACGDGVDDAEYGFLKGIRVFFANGGSPSAAWQEETIGGRRGTSYAAARFSGILAEMILKKPGETRDKLLFALEKNASTSVKPYDLVYQRKDLFGMTRMAATRSDSQPESEHAFHSKQLGRNIVLFPAKESASRMFRLFKNISPLNFKGMIDYPRNFSGGGKRRSSAGALCNVVQDASFDTLILNLHVHSTLRPNPGFARDLLVSCMKSKKQLVAWNQEVSDYVKMVSDGQTCSQEVFVPKVDDQSLNAFIQFRHLQGQVVPSILVVGMGVSRQVVLAVQLRLVELLHQDGCRVGFISTQPDGLLYGADHVFAYGNDGTVSLEESLWPIYLSSMTKALCRFRKANLVLSGTRSDVVPDTTQAHHEIAGNLLSTLRFITAFQPDGIIFVADRRLPINRIQATMQIVGTYTSAKPLFFVQAPSFWSTANRHANGTIPEREESSPVHVDLFHADPGISTVQWIDVMDSRHASLVVTLLEDAFAKG